MSKSKILTLSGAFIVILVGGWFIWQQMNSSPDAITTIGDIEQITIQKSRPAPKVDTSILKDERFIGSVYHEESSFTEQYEFIPFNEDEPAAPVEIRAHNPATGGVIWLFWKLPDEHRADGIRIYRAAATKSSSFSLLAEISSESTSYEDITVADGVKYEYLVHTCIKPADDVQEGEEALNAFCGSSKQVVESSNTTIVSSTASDEIRPLPPTGISIQNIGDGSSALIMWTNSPSDDLEQVTVYRSEVAGELGEAIADLPYANGSNMITWNIAEKKTGLRADIYRSAVSGELGSKVGSTAGPCFTDYSLVSGQSYSYAVILVDPLGTEEKLNPTIEEGRSCYFDSGLSTSIEYHYTIASVDGSGNESVGFLYTTDGNPEPFKPISF